MKRTPLGRRTPLRARRPDVTSSPAAPTRIDLSDAAAALFRQRQPRREYAGPVPDEVNNRPRTGDGSFPAVVRQTILDRDHYTCQRCGIPVDAQAMGGSIQHRAARKMGGTNAPHIARPSNGLTLCGSGTTGCHGWVEAHPDAARRAGWAVDGWADPTTVPYVRSDGWWVLLADNGAAYLTSCPPAGDAHTVAQRLSPTSNRL